jgi:hypothetical protein
MLVVTEDNLGPVIYLSELACNMWTVVVSMYHHGFPGKFGPGYRSSLGCSSDLQSFESAHWNCPNHSKNQKGVPSPLFSSPVSVTILCLPYSLTDG